MEQRLSVLEVQAAQKGQNTPPETVLEIEDLRSDLRRIDNAMRDLDRAFFVQPDLTPEGMYEAFVELRTDVGRALSPLFGDLLKIREHIDKLSEVSAQGRNDERRWRRWTVLWLAILTALVAFLVIRNIWA